MQKIDYIMFSALVVAIIVLVLLLRSCSNMVVEDIESRGLKCIVNEIWKGNNEIQSD